jgi:hypothetical protein
LYAAPDQYEFHVRVPNVGVARIPKTAIAAGRAAKARHPTRGRPVLNALAKDSVSGDPVPGVRLYVWRQKGIDAKSGPDGHIQIDGLQPGPLEFQVEAKGYARWWSAQAK